MCNKHAHSRRWLRGVLICAALLAGFLVSEAAHANDPAKETAKATPPTPEEMEAGFAALLRLVDADGSRATAPKPLAPPLQPATEPAVRTPISQPMPQTSPSSEVQAPADLWQRIRSGFAIPSLTGEAHERSLRAAQRYAQTDFLMRTQSRARLFLYHFVAEAQRRGLPTELALLPYVESALNPHARSPVGATGACQFMPETGLRFALAQSVWVDQRKDVHRCANAMYDYLSENHAKFGSWPLALAAYNWGEGAVARAIAKNQATGLPTSYEDLRMPAETQNYVPTLLGLAALVRDPAQFAAQLPAIDDLPPWVDVPLPADMDVRHVAKLAGVSLNDFLQLNPGLNRPVIPKAVQPTVLLPVAAAEKFVQALATQRLPRATWSAHRVSQPTPLKAIAKQVKAPVELLAEANGIAANRVVLAGSVLAVPKTTGQDINAELATNSALHTAAPQVAKTTRKRGKKSIAPNKRELSTQNQTNTRKDNT